MNLCGLCKNLYKDFKSQDQISDRLIFFLINFALFFKAFKNEYNKEDLQNFYDFIFMMYDLRGLMLCPVSRM